MQRLKDLFYHSLILGKAFKVDRRLAVIPVLADETEGNADLTKSRPTSIQRHIGGLFFGIQHGTIIALELCGTADLWSRSFEHTVRSYALEPHSVPSLNASSINPIDRWWTSVLNAPLGVNESVGLYGQITIETEDVCGTGVLHRGVPVFLSCFPSRELVLRKQIGTTKRFKDRWRNLRSSLA